MLRRMSNQFLKIIAGLQQVLRAFEVRTPLAQLFHLGSLWAHAQSPVTPRNADMKRIALSARCFGALLMAACAGAVVTPVPATLALQVIGEPGG